MTISPTAAGQRGVTIAPVISKRDPMFAVTLFHRRNAPLFRLAARASTEAQAIANAERVYSSVCAGIGAGVCLDGDEEDLASDPDLTQVRRGAREPESWKVQCLVRLAGDAGELAKGRQLSRGQAQVLLEEVIEADPGLLSALTKGAAIEPCPYQDWARETGWVTIDCAFRTTDEAGRWRDLRPSSSLMREATRLVVLDVLASARETVHMPLPQRDPLARHMIASATLRAARKSHGLRHPIRLVDWLKARGHRSLADGLGVQHHQP